MNYYVAALSYTFGCCAFFGLGVFCGILHERYRFEHRRPVRRL